MYAQHNINPTQTDKQKRLMQAKRLQKSKKIVAYTAQTRKQKNPENAYKYAGAVGDEQ